MGSLETNIEENAKAPAKVQGDSGAVEQFPLSEQIAADRYLASKAASRTKGLGGIKFVKISSSGAV